MCAELRGVRGFSLIEVLVLVIVLAIGLGGISMALTQQVRTSADPMIYKQAISVAEGMLEEIMSQSYALAPWSGAATCANRASFDDMRDYDGFNSTGVCAKDGTSIASLARFNVAVSVATAASDPAAALVPTTDVPAADQIRVRVSVSAPQVSISLDSYRLNY